MAKVKKAKIHSRSRSGCLECRKKRLRCDEVRPNCTRCQTKSIICKYEFNLKFKEDFEAKGAVFGREGTWGNTQNNTNDLSLLAKSQFYQKIVNKSYHFINHSFRDMIKIGTNLKTSIIPIEIRDYTGYSVNYALSCYIEHISPIFNPIKIKSLSQKNHISLADGLNFVNLVQYSQSHPHIFNLLLSIGSRFLARNDSSGVWATHACDFRRAALSELKLELDKLQMLSLDNEEVVFDLLLSTLLLCLFDIADDCHDEWSKHLEMAKWLTTRFNLKPSNEVEEKTLMFITDFFSYQEAMGRTACKKTSIFESEVWTEQDDDNVLITWMGCNRKLVNIISDITDLSYERASPGHLIDNGSYLQLTSTIETGINSLKQLDWGSWDYTEECCFLLGCEVKRLSTLLYMRCSLLNKTPKDNQNLVWDINRYLKFIIIENHYCWSFLLWPIFIMSSNIDPLDSQCENLRASTLEFLNVLETTTLGNVNKAREIILSVWKKRDLFDSKDAKLSKSNGQDVLGSVNDWEYFVADKKLNISLA